MGRIPSGLTRSVRIGSHAMRNVTMTAFWSEGTVLSQRALRFAASERSHGNRKAPHPVREEMRGAAPAPAAAFVLPLILAACAAGTAPVGAARTCGEPPATPSLGSAGTPPPTPTTGPPNATNTTGPVMVIGAWPDCFRPQIATVHTGQLIQWQARRPGMDPELVLEDGTSLGRITHVLEFRAPQPGTYRYHVRNDASVAGTIVVEAPRP